MQLTPEAQHRSKMIITTDYQLFGKQKIENSTKVYPSINELDHGINFQVNKINKEISIRVAEYIVVAPVQACYSEANSTTSGSLKFSLN